ncbi:hypothetical protein RHMOL_Rhmol04G0227400 [Rhododendron molle]|uniref:Uncharacterized protein n=1 Tax=Rhododendron molle TaxID=49168 RepID=A0ACC0P4W9_RHOML|nr:hypothetical protein RHMOL_Rhmol04G0227400 [Rhododendron molle]
MSNHCILDAQSMYFECSDSTLRMLKLYAPNAQVLNFKGVFDCRCGKEHQLGDQFFGQYIESEGSLSRDIYSPAERSILWTTLLFPAYSDACFQLLYWLTLSIVKS